jgi:hypothetical protein
VTPTVNSVASFISWGAKVCVDGAIASAVEEVFAGEIDSYAELAALFALKIRPRSVSEARAVRVAQEELDRLVMFPSKGPLLVSLVEGIIKNLVHWTMAAS